jgi:transcriptional regulator with XRE-family HTH domain
MRNKSRRSLYTSPAFTQLAQRLRIGVTALRAEKRWTQTEAAEQCRLPLRSYQAVESGKSLSNATLVTLGHLSAGYRVDVGELFGKLPTRLAQFVTHN